MPFFLLIILVFFFFFFTFYFVLGYSQLGFPWWLSSKESAYDMEDAECPRFDPWVGKIPWRRAWQSTPVLLPGESPWTEEPGRLQSLGSQRVGHS